MSNEILESVRNCPRETLPAVLAECFSRLLAPPAPLPAKVQTLDRLLPAREAAQALSVSISHLYHHDYFFTVRDPRTRRLRFSANGIARYIEQQTRK